MFFWEDMYREAAQVGMDIGGESRWKDKWFRRERRRSGRIFQKKPRRDQRASESRAEAADSEILPMSLRMRDEEGHV